jgi:WD40 repeat protein
MPKTFLNDLNYHKERVKAIEWSPYSQNIFMSGADDNKVFVWDFSKVGEE